MHHCCDADSNSNADADFLHGRADTMPERRFLFEDGNLPVQLNSDGLLTHEIGVGCGEFGPADFVVCELLEDRKNIRCRQSDHAVSLSHDRSRKRSTDNTRQSCDSLLRSLHIMDYLHNCLNLLCGLSVALRDLILQRLHLLLAESDRLLGYQSLVVLSTPAMEAKDERGDDDDVEQVREEPVFPIKVEGHRSNV